MAPAGARPTLEERLHELRASRAEHLPAIEGREPTDPYLILLDGQPVAFIQTYLVSAYPDWAQVPVDSARGPVA